MRQAYKAKPRWHYVVFTVGFVAVFVALYLSEVAR